MKKKIILPVILAVVAFVLSYIVCCCILKIKLAADPFTYFVENAKHMFFFKAAVSAVIAGLIGTVAYYFTKTEES